jgi:hypothetical protein
MLAMNLRSPRGVRFPALSLTSIASVLAPTGREEQSHQLSGRKKGFVSSDECVLRQRPLCWSAPWFLDVG